MALREKTVEALAELVEDEAPEPLVDGEMQRAPPGPRACACRPRASTLEQYLEATGQSAGGAASTSSRGTPRTAVKVDLALRAVAEAEAHRGRPTRTSTPRSSGWPSGSSEKPAKVRAATRARRAGAGGTLGPQEAQGARVAGRARRDRRRGGQPRSSRARSRASADDDRGTTPSTTPNRRRTRRPRRDAADPQLPGAHGRRADEPGRAGLRPLLAAAQGAHHLPRHADRRHDRQPRLRPAAAPRGGEPRQGHQPLHQLARAATSPRCSRSTTRCSTSSPTSPRSASARPPRPPPCCWPAGTKGKRLALPHARILLHQPYGGGAAARPPTSRSRPRRSCGCATCSTRSSPTTPARPSRRSSKDTDRDFVMSADGGQGLRHHRRGHHSPRAGRQQPVPITGVS